MEEIVKRIEERQAELLTYVRGDMLNPVMMDSETNRYLYYKGQYRGLQKALAIINESTEDNI